MKLPMVLLLFAASLHAQTSLPKYAVIKTEAQNAFVTRLNELADQGYRVLAVGRFTLLRLDAYPPDTFRYLRIEGSGGPKQFHNWINEQGAHGYRWLPHTGLLEKAPHPRNYEYVTAHHGIDPSKAKDLSVLAEQGYRPLDTVSFSFWGASTQESYFEHDVDEPAPSPPQYPGTSIAIADAMRVGKVLEQVNDLAKKGYQFLALHASRKGGGMAVMMQKCPADCSGRYEYRYFDAKDPAQVEHELNALAHDGFRVVPATLVLRPHLLERDSQSGRVFVYRVLPSSDAPTLETQVNSADTEGFVPINFVWHVGWSAEGFLILEKEIIASTNP